MAKQTAIIVVGLLLCGVAVIAGYFIPRTMDALPRPDAVITAHSPVISPVMKGAVVDKKNQDTVTLLFDGGSSDHFPKALFERAHAMFLAGISAEAKTLWVNLDPHEEARMIDARLQNTELGKTLMQQDYVLKVFSSSLTDPSTENGRKYWVAVGLGAQTQEKIWLVPDRIVLREDGRGAMMIESATLKAKIRDDASAVIADAFRTYVLPQVEKAVNGDAMFEPLRQAYHAVIVSSWVKRKLGGSVLDVTARAHNTDEIATVPSDVKNLVFKRYRQSFERGVYRKSIPDVGGGKRLYFSGGVILQAVSGSAVRTLSGDIDPERFDRVKISYALESLTIPIKHLNRHVPRENLEKIVIMYDALDTDGEGSGATAYRWYKEHYPHADIVCIPYSYDQEIPTEAIESADELVVADVSFNPVRSGHEKRHPMAEIAEKYRATGRNFIWIDHHYVDDYADLFGARDDDHSAAELTWLYFYGDKPMPDILKAIGDRDLLGERKVMRCPADGENSHLASSYFVKGMNETLRDPTHPDWVPLLNGNGRAAQLKKVFVARGMTILDPILAQERKRAESSSFMTDVVADGKTYLFYAVQGRSEPETHAELTRSHPLVLSFSYIVPEDRWVVSQRSDGTTDVSVPASALGGGGRPVRSASRGKVLPFVLKKDYTELPKYVMTVAGKTVLVAGSTQMERVSEDERARYDAAVIVDYTVGGKWVVTAQMKDRKMFAEIIRSIALQPDDVDECGRYVYARFPFTLTGKSLVLVDPKYADQATIDDLIRTLAQTRPEGTYEVWVQDVGSYVDPRPLSKATDVYYFGGDVKNIQKLTDKPVVDVLQDQEAFRRPSETGGVDLSAVSDLVIDVPDVSEAPVRGRLTWKATPFARAKKKSVR